MTNDNGPRALVLLPPSETKRDGGSAVSGKPARELDGGVLGFSSLDAIRGELIDALVHLAADAELHARTLKLSAKLSGVERERNLTVRTAARMPAIDRYTGVLYDALAASELGAAAREWLAQHVVIQSALFGLVRATDAIPAYRCSATSRIGGLTMRSRWAAACAAELETYSGPILDLRSTSYTALGPLPNRPNTVSVDVVARTPEGRLVSLNHFNKRGKGLIVRALSTAAGEVQARLDGAQDAGELAEVLRAAGIRADAVGERQLRIEVDDPRVG